MREQALTAPARLRRRLHRLWQLPATHRWLLLQALVAVPALRILLRAAGLRRVHAVLSRSAAPRSARRADPRWSTPQGVQAAVTIVDMAARCSPLSNTCLHRSLALWWLLSRRGVDCQIRLGARRNDARFDAHAWIEYNGSIINDDTRRIQEYVPLAWHPADRLP